MKNKRAKVYSVIIWMMIGSLVLCAAYFTYANNFKKLSFSRINDDIYEAGSYIGTGTLQNGRYEVYFSVDFRDYDVNYLKISTDGITNDAQLKVYFGDYFEEKGFVPVENIEDNNLRNGTSYYKLPAYDFTFIVIDIYGPNEIVINNLAFTENVQDKRGQTAVPFLLIVIISYVLLSGGLNGLKTLLSKKRLKMPDLMGSINKNQDNYLRIYNSNTLSIELAQKNRGIICSIIRVVAITVLLLNSLLISMHAYGKYYISDFNEYLIIQLIFLSLIILSLLFDVANRGNKLYDGMALSTCTCFALYTLASDLLVPKTFQFAVALIFLFLSVVGFICYQNNNCEKYIKDVKNAVHCFLIVLIIVSILIPNHGDDPRRYSGPLQNPSIFALYIGGIWAVLLGVIEHYESSKPSAIKKVFLIIEMGAVLIMGLASQSMTPLIAMFLTTCLWAFRRIAKKRGSKYAIRLLIVFGAIGIAGFIGAILLIRNSNIEINSRILLKFRAASISSFLSGRDYFWRAYLRKLNLFGHAQKPYIWRTKINPHNAAIGMAYKYGTPCVVPYIIMFMLAVEKSYRYANRYTPYAAVPLYSIVTFVIMGLADNVEQPLVWLPTIVCYLLMAPILLMPVEEIENGGLSLPPNTGEITDSEVQIK